MTNAEQNHKINGNLYSIYSSVKYVSDEYDDFFAVKNLMNTVNQEVIDIESIFSMHSIIQQQDIGKYCYVPGDLAEIQSGIVCYTDFYYVDINTLDILGKISTHPKTDSEDKYMILCDVKYAKEHGWM
ncbi:MAG: hypothetical protein LBC71_05035 [Oscillospiraceae bacterium]|jgi:hypothetical protein|nr:hypothetical protein [Oscillospiraceae bacterium]